MKNKKVGYFVMALESYPYTPNILNHGWRTQWWHPSTKNYLNLRHNHSWQSWQFWSLDYTGTIEGRKLWWIGSFLKNGFWEWGRNFALLMGQSRSQWMTQRIFKIGGPLIPFLIGVLDLKHHWIISPLNDLTCRDSTRLMEWYLWPIFIVQWTKNSTNKIKSCWVQTKKE